MTTFQSLGLSEEIIKSVLDAGYSTPTPVQAEAIPIACSGQDLIACAQTGTGKTAGFVLPMLSRLLENPRPRKGRPVRALVIAPTRELAMQVEEAVRIYGKHCKFKSLSVYGGVGIRPQLQGLRRGVDIVVATPGRLLDHMNRGTFDASEIELLILDEADRMLDMGFLPDIRKVVAEAPKNRQTLLFSATMPASVQKLAESIMHNPSMIEVGERRNPAETVTQQVCMIPQQQKMGLLHHVLETETTDNVLIFSRTKHRANKIHKKLGQWGYSTTVIHSNRSQSQRQSALRGFKTGRYQIMVATDIAARGIDVDSISHVINFDTPDQAEDYIHRIGRTGRARTSGDAITFVAHQEQGYLKRIEGHTGKSLARKVYEGFDPSAEIVNKTSGERPAGKRSNDRDHGKSGGQGRSGNSRSSGGANRGSSGGSQTRARHSGPGGRSKSSGGGSRSGTKRSFGPKRAGGNASSGGQRTGSSSSRQGGHWQSKWKKDEGANHRNERGGRGADGSRSADASKMDDWSQFGEAGEAVQGREKAPERPSDSRTSSRGRNHRNPSSRRQQGPAAAGGYSGRRKPGQSGPSGPGRRRSSSDSRNGASAGEKTGLDSSGPKRDRWARSEGGTWKKRKKAGGPSAESRKAQESIKSEEPTRSSRSHSGAGRTRSGNDGRPRRKKFGSNPAKGRRRGSSGSRGRRS